MFSEPIFYKWLGGGAIALLAVIVGLTIYILTGQHGRKKVVLIAGTVLAGMITVSAFCVVIYAEYGS